MSAAEFPRPVRLDTLGAAPRTIAIEADEAERAALARRFGLVALDMLRAEAAVRRDGEAVIAEGRIVARADQACVATGVAVPASVDAAFALRFVPETAADEEVELDAADLDTVPYEGGAIDLGEAAAQELSLALDPFPRSPEADAALARAGVLSEDEAAAQRAADSPFAKLGALKRDG